MDRLREKILVNVRHVERRRARGYVAVAAAVLVLSLLGMVMSLRYALQGFADSGFYNYASLAFSDTDLLVLFWKEFTLSLIESLPLLGLLAFLVAFAGLLGSVRMLARHLRAAHVPLFA